MPIEPEPCAWAFPPAQTAGPDGVVALGADLAPGTLLAAYRAGMFPMPHPDAPGMVWWSPDPRGVVPLGRFHVSRSLRRTRRRYAMTVDRAFSAAMAGGLYGVEIGGLFAAESKFHVRTDASKAALAALVDRLCEAGGERLLDVQWTTPHLRTLGAVDVARADYLERLRAAVALPPAFG